MTAKTSNTIYAILGTVYACLLAAMQQNLVPAHYVAWVGVLGIGLAAAMKAVGSKDPPAVP